MAYEADRVVVELLAQNDQFDAATKSSAANFQQSMAGIQTSGAAAEAGVGRFSSALKENRLSMNQSRVGMMEFQHIARGVSDQMGVGASASQILTSHVGELSEAIVLSGGAFGKLGLFLQGPWGIALTLATTAVVALVTKHKQESDTLDEVYGKLVKHKEQTQLSSEAEDIWSHSIDGLIDRSKKLNEELDKRLQTQTDLQRHTLSDAEEQFAAATAAAAKLETTPGSTQKQIDDAQAAIKLTSIALHNAQVLAAQDAGDAIASITQSAKTATDVLLHAIQIVQTAHPELAEKSVANQMLGSFDQLKDAINAAAAANLDFNGTVTQTNALNAELLSGSISVQTYDQKIQSLAKSLREAAEAAKNAPQALSQFKQAISGAEGTGANKLGSSAFGVGQFMPDTWRHYFAQAYPNSSASDTQMLALRSNPTVAKGVIEVAANDYATSLKAAGQNITEASLYAVHLLSAGDPKIRTALKLLNAPAGESTSSFLSAGVLRGNPFLQGTAGDARAAIAKRIGDSSGAVSAGAAAILQEQLAAAKKQAEQDAAFQSEMDRLNGEYIAARKGQVKDALAQLDFGEEEVAAEQKKRDDGYRSSAISQKITQAQADQLITVSATVAAEKIRALETQKQIVLIQRADDAAERTAQYQEDNLRAAEQEATSQAQRRELDLAILDILYDEKLAHLERLKLLAEANKDLQAANDLQAQIDQLPAQKANDRSGVLRQTMDPLEQWLHSVPHDAQAVTEALQGIAVNGFDQIASSIAGVVTGTETLGQAFGNIARQIVGDLIQMTIKMLIFRALSSVIGGGLGVSGGLSISPDISSPLAMPALSGGLTASSLPPLAGGGSGVIGGIGGVDNNLLSLNGQPIAWVSQGEGLTISPSNASAASPFATGGRAVVIVGVQANDYFDAQVLHVTGPVIAQASGRSITGGAALAQHTLARAALHRLG